MKAKIVMKVCLGACILMLLPACASLKDNTPISLHTHLYEKAGSCSEEDKGLKTCDAGIPERDILEAEKPLYPSYFGASPTDYRLQLAIGLSGGGQRAASTAIGLLMPNPSKRTI